jgi:hypothetical protein
VWIVDTVIHLVTYDVDSGMDAGTGMFGLVVLLGPGTSNDGVRSAVV